jgi:hypothetical protein
LPRIQPATWIKAHFAFHGDFPGSWTSTVALYPDVVRRSQVSGIFQRLQLITIAGLEMF